MALGTCTDAGPTTPVRVGTDTIKIRRFTLRFYRMSDGTRHIDSAGFNALWSAMRRGLELSTDEAARVRRFMRGDPQ